MSKPTPLPFYDTLEVEKPLIEFWTAWTDTQQLLPYMSADDLLIEHYDILTPEQRHVIVTFIALWEATI